MSKIIKTAKMLRRNWKKSTFFFGVLAYGSSYFIDRYKTFEMMRAYCEEARKYGEQPLPQMKKPKHITVILNPEANNKKSNVQFEKFAAPLLHLAGFKVSVFQTEKEKQALELMQVMSNTDAVIIAGGNGTLHEAVTGLLRRPRAEDEILPLGIVPLGKTNTVARYLFESKSSSNAQLMAEAVMAVIRETTVKLDTLKVQYEDEDLPIYAMCNFEQGVFADIDPLVQKYWYLGALKDKFTYFTNSLKNWKGVEIEKLEYVAPCDGCSKCYRSSKRKAKGEQRSRWWSAFVPRTENKESQAELEKEKIIANKVNENCGKHIELQPSYSNLSVSTTYADPKSLGQPSSLWIKIFPKDLSILQFISSGLSHRESKHQDTTGLASIIKAREVIMVTERSDSNQMTLAEETATSNQTASPNFDQAELNIVSSEESGSEAVTDSTESNHTGAVDSDAREPLIDSTESGAVDSKEANSSNSIETNSKEEKSKIDKNLYSYIDNEKYKRASCIISLLPKQVTVYG